MTDRFPNRRWIFLTSGDLNTKVNFSNIMETSAETCRYNLAGTESFVKYEIIKFPQDNQAEIPIYSGFHQENGTGDATWDDVYDVPLRAVQSGTYDTYEYDYQVTGSGVYLEQGYLTGSGGNITGEAITGSGYYPLYADNILGSGLFAPSGTITGRPPCYEYALDVEFSGVTKNEFMHQEMLSILSGPDWTPTGDFQP
jgi:hypothetical protein